MNLKHSQFGTPDNNHKGGGTIDSDRAKCSAGGGRMNVGGSSPVPALQIKRLEIWNFSGVEHAKIEPQLPGVTVVHGPNESGKSTFVAAFQLLLNPSYRRDTQAKDVIKYKTRGKDLAFTVEADLVLGSYELTMRKEFKKPGGQSILTIHSPRVENLSGNEAEDRFHELLAENVDLGLRSALTVNQGDDLGQVIPAKVNSLGGAMAENARREDGVDDSTDPGTAGSTTGVDATNGARTSSDVHLFNDEAEEHIFAAVQKEYSQYFTRSGRSAKLLKGLEEAAKEAQTAQVAAEQRYDQALGLITSLETAQRERQKARDDRPGAEAAVEAAEANLKQAESRDAQLKQAQSLVDVAELNRQNLQSTAEKRQELIAERERVAEKVANLKDSRKTAETAAAEEKAALSSVLAVLTDTRSHLDAVRAWQQVAETVRVGLQQAQQQTREENLLAELAELQSQSSELSKKLGETVTPELAQSFRDAVANYRAELRILDSVSTQVNISGPVGAKFTEGGQEVALPAEGYATSLASTRNFGFGEFQVEIRPHEDRTDARDSVQRSTKKLRSVATRIGIALGADESSTGNNGTANGERITSEALDAALGELVAKESQRAELEEQLRSLESSIALKTAGRSHTEVQNAIGSLSSSIDAAQAEAQEQLQSALEAESDASVEFPGREVLEAFVESANVGSEQPEVGNHEGSANTVEKPSSAGAFNVDGKSSMTEALSSVEEGIKALNQLLKKAEQSVQQAQNKREELAGTPHTIALERVKSELDIHAERLETVEAQLKAQREKIGDGDVASAVEDAKHKLAQAQAAANELRESFHNADGVEDAQLKLDSATTARDNLVRREQQLSEDIVRYSTELNNAATAKEDAEAARIATEKAERKLAEVQRKAAAAKLLLEELTKARDEKQAKYQEPFKRQFEALARYTFGPESEFSFDQDLRVSARLRGGLSLERELLSGGAQEQIGLLTRLTVASLVGQGGSVPIILDDVLGFSDDERAEGMRLALGSVGREHQIIVFTCAPERFEGVAKAQVLSMAEAKRG